MPITRSISKSLTEQRVLMSAALRGLLGRLLQINRTGKRIIVLVSDLALCFLAVVISFSLRLGYWQIASLELVYLFLAGAILFPPIFFFNGIYSSILRFSGSGTIIELARACAVLSIPMVAIFMMFGISGVPRTLAFLFPLVFFLLVAISRIVARYLLTDVLRGALADADTKRVLIYGAGWAGQQLARSLAAERQFELVGYLDDDSRLARQRLDGVKIYDARNMAKDIEDYRIDTVFLALPNISRSRRLELVAKLQDCPVHVQTLPVIQDILDGHVSVDDLREIDIEDLLGRDPVPPNELLLGRTIIGKTVMVTGAGGSIGSELCRQIIRLKPQKLVLYEMTEHALFEIERELNATLDASQDLHVDLVAQLGSVCDRNGVQRIFERFRPDTVFHAAAYKHVPLVESNPLSGLRNNVMGTYYTADAALAADVTNFILVSTDKAVRPSNVMGATKRICEQICQAFAETSQGTKFAMVRFGNVLGSSGSVVPQFKTQIRNGGPVTVTHRDVTRYFMTIPEAAQLVIQAGAMAQGGEVYLLDMGKSVRILDLARTMIELSGRTLRDAENPEGDIEIVEVGLRPGEKLYEELLIGNDPEPTQHPAIMRAREGFLPFAVLSESLTELASYLDTGDYPAALEMISRLVPEYDPADNGDVAAVPA